ncbi:hypothetical protein IPF86_00435 [Candidatus Nomurabacteria bacterium]|nr:MAG: hypothetical protein IPF86_00435 [Candidatus Nomurabacteria bacterium]
MEHEYQKIAQQISCLYPDLPEKVLRDFARLLSGNKEHISVIRSSDRPIDFDHQERVIGFGNGFDWLHEPNLALILNPFDIDSIGPLKTAGKVLTDNLEKRGITPEGGLTFMVSSPYRESGSDYKHAILKADDLICLGYQVIKDNYPKLLDMGLQFIAGTMNENDRHFQRLDMTQLRYFREKGYAQSEDNPMTVYLLKRNEEQSSMFVNKHFEREKYRRNFSTEIMAFKCMDGRINLSLATETPVGIIQPIRNVGAKFSLGWKALYDKVKAWLQYSLGRDREALVLATYHFSAEKPHLGCAGHDYNTEQAKQNAIAFAKDVDDVFGSGKLSPINSIVIGFNTDDDSLIIWDKSGKEKFEVASLLPSVNSYEEQVRIGAKVNN